MADVVHRFNPYLHGTRGLLSFMIVIYHVVNSGLPTLPVLSRGWPLFGLRSLQFGVELFFGISGIVIVGALARARGPLVFAVERGTRIYPVLWASIACIVILSGVTGLKESGPPSPLVLGANLLALPPLIAVPIIHPAAWSLSFEMAFYASCALAWALHRRLGWPAYLLIGPAALAAAASHVRVVLMPVGMVVAFLLARRPELGRHARAPGLCMVAFLLLWQLVYRDTGADLTPLGWADLPRPAPGLAALATLAAGFSFFGILTGRGLLCRLLVLAPLQFLGAISYSLYLWHPIVLAVVKHLLYRADVPERAGSASQLLFLMLSLPVSLLLAWVSQRLLEKRLTTYLRCHLERLFGERPRHPVPVTVRSPAPASQSGLEP